MKFTTLSEKEFNEFAKEHEIGSYFQTVECARLRKLYGSKIHYLGVKKDNKILCASMFTEDKAFLNKTRFYAQRGYLIDYHDKELLNFYTVKLKEYARKHNAFEIKIDPYLIYRKRNKDGSILEGDPRDDESINNLLNLGYEHYGFNKDFIYTNCRYVYQLDIKGKSYDELFNNFTKSTRKNIISSRDKAVKVKEISNAEDINVLEEMIAATGERKKYSTRTTSYYKNMKDTFNELVTYFIAYIDTEEYFKLTKKALDNEKQFNKDLVDEMSRINVGNKMKNKKRSSDNKIIKLTKELEYAEKLKLKGNIPIAGLVSLISGKSFLSLSSGTLSKYRDFYPKYALYEAHIKKAVALELDLVDFYGISGDMEPKSEDYGIFEFKQGFDGYVSELIGEFSLPLHFSYHLFKFLRNVKRKVFKR